MSERDNVAKHVNTLAKPVSRATLALLNAYTSGALRGIDSLAAALKAKGLKAPLLFVHSNGGSITVD